MKVQRTIPPVAAILSWKDIWSGLCAFLSGDRNDQKLESEIADYFGVRHAFLTSSGKAALYLVMEALKTLSPGKTQVVIPAYTCFSVPSAILKAGLNVVPCDQDQSTLDFNYAQLEQTVTEDTLCVLPTHLFGMPADVERVNDLCRKKGIFVVEDAAQAMGGINENSSLLGTLGDVGIFSLGRGKNITCGSGGIIITNSTRLAAAIGPLLAAREYPSWTSNIREFCQLLFMATFIRPSLYWFPSGLPFLRLGLTVFHHDFPVNRLSSMQRGILTRWKSHLENSNRIRKEVACWIGETLKTPVIKLGATPYLRIPIITDSRETRDKLHEASRERGLGFSLMYPTPVDEIDELHGHYPGRSFPAAKNIAERLIAMPAHCFLSNRDKEEIENLLFSFGLLSKR